MFVEVDARMPNDVEIGKGELHDPPTVAPPGTSEYLVLGEALTSKLSKSAFWDCVKLDVLTSMSPSELS